MGFGASVDTEVSRAALASVSNAITCSVETLLNTGKSNVNERLSTSIMSTTTQILFNSPALHSLKRDQLVKLCKIHSIKANGKNVELIQRLRQHAQTLPKDSPLNIAVRSDNPPEIQQHKLDEEEGDCVPYRNTMPRPSEQWEVVMDSIVEVEENSQGTLSSQRTVSNNGTVGEFGTGSSRCVYRALNKEASNTNLPLFYSYNLRLVYQSTCQLFGPQAKPLQAYTINHHIIQK
jgi:hypothetical protein